MIPQVLVWGTLSLFPISEIILCVLKRATSRDATVQDRGTLKVLWVVITAAVFMAIVAKMMVTSTRFHVSSVLSDMLSIILTMSGLTLRWVSILTLGRYFTVNIAIHPNQHVVRTGPYRYIRHPSYTGMLLAFLGLGIYFANWLSIFVLLLPIIVATLNRIKKEEETLLKALGSPYLAYCQETKRLIPWLF